MSKFSKYIGVSFGGSQRKSPWRTRVSIGSETFNLGYFKTQKEAALMYNQFIKANRLDRPLNNIR